MMAVIPVYTNPETGKRYHFSDSPKLLKILKQMQQDGGSVVLHGYTHQFRMSETGEGFEFWDVEQNMPIYADADESFTLRSESDFSSKTKYEQYILQLQKFESEYTRRKINRGIQEMVNYGLYPLAFEAPHYTMSQHGYEVVSDYFSTYVGQIQLSDEDWEVMDTTPYITSPQFLHGIELIPETMSYVKPNDPNSIEKMMRRANNYKKTTDGVLGAFYHPYLGADRFIEVIERMEKIPNISWINLKERDIWVKTEHIYLYTENGEIVTEVNRGKLLLSSIDFPLYHLNKLLKGIIWSIAGISMIAVCAFIHLTIVTYKNNNVQLGSE